MNAIDYGFKDTSEYIRTNQDTMCRFIQIEHREAVENLDAIMKIPYIYGYIFGANDLSGSYNMLGDIFSDKITSVIRETTERLHKVDKYVGLSTGNIRESTLRHWHSLGIDSCLPVQTLIACGNPTGKTEKGWKPFVNNCRNSLLL